MKIIQWLLKILSFINIRLAVRVTNFLIRFPRKLPTKERDLGYIHSAKTITFNRNGEKVALSWGAGPVVILVHGWEGRSTQMAVIAQQLANNGFQAIALDFSGHGLSGGRQSGFSDFIEDLAALKKYVEENISPNIHAMVGHSAGGVCMMASRLINDFSTTKYVVISGPSAPYTAINALRRVLKVGDDVLALVQDGIAESFKCTWQELLAGYAYTKRFHDEQLFLIYDHDDKMVDHNEAQKIQKTFHTNDVYKTQGNGHIKLLWDDCVVEKIVNFVSSK
jgi:esterase/lipase